MDVALIGSREPYDNIKPLSRQIGKYFSENGSSGYSGGAVGMDSLFMEKFDIDRSFVIVPERKPSTPEHHIVWDEMDNQTKIKSYLQAKRVCPDIDIRPLYHQKLFARNSCQVLGIDCMSPVDRVVFWAKETGSGLVSGGTRIAVRIARDHGIPCDNLYKEETRRRYENMIGYSSKPATLGDWL